jgi:hypothetical protein
MRFFFALVMLLFGALGCTGFEVAASDLTRTWVIKDASRERLPTELRTASPKIVLHANGSFVATSMPGLFYVPPGVPELDAGSGVWKLVSREGGQQLQLDFHLIEDGKERKVPIWHAALRCQNMGFPPFSSTT